jgi:hypothetical protein
VAHAAWLVVCIVAHLSQVEANCKHDRNQGEADDPHCERCWVTLRSGVARLALIRELELPVSTVLDAGRGKLWRNSNIKTNFR